MDARQAAALLRDEMVETLATTARMLANEPDPGRQMDKALQALGIAEDACAAMTVALSTSSHPSYAERDLPEQTGKAWLQARHSMRMLRTLYGPREEPCPDPGHHADPVRIVRDSPQA
jgi:hypothetical protein